RALRLSAHAAAALLLRSAARQWRGGHGEGEAGQAAEKPSAGGFLHIDGCSGRRAGEASSGARHRPSRTPRVADDLLCLDTNCSSKSSSNRGCRNVPTWNN
ncbi:Os06g0585900, partial [Oryza sativa Japonica Group]